jgi:two-component system, chemotaxis family, sensor kinase CheA
METRRKTNIFLSLIKYQIFLQNFPIGKAGNHQEQDLMSDADNAFFQELQGEFLTESAFMFEQYEESMLGLETGANIQGDLAQIFRVAHSIKGGASAVGFPDLAKFAHVVEDLLALLRMHPEFLSSSVISLLLKSGDMLKNRIHSLQKGEDGPWDTASLASELTALAEKFGGDGETAHGHNEAPLDIDAAAAMAAAEEAAVGSSAVEEDVANHELLAELAAQFGQEETSEVVTPAPGAMIAPAAKSEEKPAPVAATTAPAGNTAVSVKSNGEGSGKGGGNKSTTSSIKVDTGRVDSVLDAVGELVVLKNQIVHDESIRSGGNLRLAAIVDQLDKTVRELYDKTLSIRMTPLKSLFLKIQRIVRDVSLNLEKPVDLQLIGEETEVERTVFELLGDPLVHLVRNSMDHGIEKPEIRKERGKTATAKVVVSAKQTGGTVTIEIIDDGGGINRERVLQKAIEKKLIPHGVDPQSMPDEQVFQFIFAPGFSTAEKVTDLSGRGVGLDVVRSNLEKINGKIDIKSKVGIGTTFRLSIPLSTAITDGIVVAIDGAKYILPIYSIRELVRAVPKDYTHLSNAGKVVKIREVLLPVIDIRKTIGKINWDQIKHMKYESKDEKDSLRARREETMLIIIESMHGMMALPVDEVIGQAQVVVKPISAGHEIPEVAGAAILGDGRTVLILDPTALTQIRQTEANQETSA